MESVPEIPIEKAGGMVGGREEAKPARVEEPESDHSCGVFVFEVIHGGIGLLPYRDRITPP
jgi:hypothetical protein